MNIGTQDITISPILSPDEMDLGTLLRMDSHADTRCINKHAFIESIVEISRFDAVPFDKTIGKPVTYQSLMSYINMKTPIHFAPLFYKSTMWYI